jgi:hypothetical protein
MKLPAHRVGLPGHAVACRLRAKVISFILSSWLPVGRDPAYKAGLAGHVPANETTPLNFLIVTSKINL